MQKVPRTRLWELGALNFGFYSLVGGCGGLSLTSLMYLEESWKGDTEVTKG